MTTQDPGTSGASDSESAKPEPDKTEPAKPDLTKPSESASGADTPERSSESEHTPPPDLGRAFDYDATAQASLSAQPPTLDSLGGATGTPGPGWDTYSGVGNGPGWGTTPSYPPPAEHESDYPSPGDYPYGEHQGRPETGTGPVYGTPDPHFPIGSPQQDPSQGRYTGPQGSHQAPGYGPPPQGGQGYGPPPGYGVMPAYGYPDPSNPYGRDAAAPFGRDPYTGEPYSDKSKVTAGVLEILLGPFGAGRFYLDQPGTAVAQIAVTWLTCGIGGIWPLIDGILMLTGKVRDKNGRQLRP
ncbi:MULTISPECIES: TM2 domain-containing protein [Rhodococcus]|uniref:TM2 domain-containing protein n=1 Tax=Rhodococcus TaxID=1827 RepID=UPI001E479718|nr:MULTISPECIES: TM2 domain-containing protein [Rhodococcus]MCB8908810.1 TM2 domain-containing protein [Rhodococcus rhodochrous]WSE20827.1 TM2 domain-containing protein [Rhodococcus sp. PD04]